MGNNVSQGLKNFGNTISNGATSVYNNAIAPAGVFLGQYTGGTAMVNNWNTLTHSPFSINNLGNALLSTGQFGLSTGLIAPMPPAGL